MRQVTLRGRSAARLYRILTERPGEYTAAELQRELGVTRAGLQRLLDELEEEHLITQEVEEND